MTKTYTLAATQRTELGQAAKKLRRVGKIPATLYGKGKTNLSLTVDEKALATIVKEAGKTQLVEVVVEGAGKHTVLLHAVQRHPVTGVVMHIEFFQVNLTEKMHSSVPVRIVGDSPAVAQNLGTLLTPIQMIDVESYPQDIPEAIEVDVTVLTELDQEIKVQDLKLPATVTILTDLESVVAKIGAITVEEEIPTQPTEAGTAESGEAPAEAATIDTAEEKTTE